MKVAVIGRGFGASMMVPAYRALGCEVALVPSRDAAAVAEACRAPVDLVSIHSPPFQHHDHVMAALEAGRNVLCDKPFGRNAAEAQGLRDAARRAGVLHFLNFEFRALPSWRRASQLLREGAIGSLRHVTWISLRGGQRGKPYGWLNQVELGGGWIGAHGAHVIDGLRGFFGCEVDECGGLTRIDTRFPPDASGEAPRATAEDGFSAWLVMADGGTASIDSCNTAATIVPSSIHLLGTEGTIAITGENLLTWQRAGQAPERFDYTPQPGEHPFPAVPLWLEAVVAAVTERRQIAPNFDDGVAVAEVMERLRHAAKRAG